jgi:tetratricopeptide (TPR) repeat protein
VYLLSGRREQAMRHYELAVRFGPDNAEAIYNLATQLDAGSAHQRAEALYRRFLEIAPPYLAEQRAWVSERLKTGTTRAPLRQ